MDRPLILNSLLTFIHNYRDSPRLRPLVAEFFPVNEIVEAEQLLEKRVGKGGDVYSLYDAVVATGRTPLFAATDLTVMPIVLIDNTEKDEMIREMRGLRRFITEALNGRIDDLSSRVYDSSSSSSEGDLIHPSKPSSPSISSPDRLLSTPSEMDTSTSSASTEKSCGEIDVGQPTKLDQSMLEDRTSEKSVSFDGPPSKKRCSRSLDAAVAKLNDIQKTKIEPLSPTPSMPSLPPATVSLCPAPPPPAPSVPTPTRVLPPSMSQLPMWASSMQLDPQSYLALISRLVQSQMPPSVVAPPTVPPPLPHRPPSSVHSAASPREDLSEERRGAGTADLEDEEEDGEKGYDDSSPSPSEQMMMKDDEGDDEDKPFVCPHVNCLKRFGNKFLLKKHQFIHTGLRPHACPYCSKRFNRKDNLLRHKKTHIGGDEPPSSGVNISLLLAAATQDEE